MAAFQYHRIPFHHAEPFDTANVKRPAAMEALDQWTLAATWDFILQYLWANGSRRTRTWVEVYHKQKRAEGKSRACALRCLGQRWLRIIWRILHTRQPFDPNLHQENQLKHGSWVLSLIPEKRITCPSR